MSAILHDNNSMGEVVAFLQPDDFQEVSHTLIYNAMKELYMDNKVIDVATLSQRLGGSLGEIGGITYIAQLTTQGITSANIKQYAEIIKENSNLKFICLNLEGQVEDIKKNKTNSLEVSQNIQQMLFKINDVKSSDGEIKEATADLINVIEERYKNGGKIQGISTGFSKIDTRINGLVKKNMVTIAARPSIGKTAFALNIATNASKSNKVVMFSLEMSKQEILEIILSKTSGVDLSKIKLGNLVDNDWQKVAQASAYIASSKLKIYDDIFHIDRVVAEVRNLAIKGELDILIVDYLQLIETRIKEGRTQEVSYISRQLKKLAQEFGITVIALSQLSRAPELRQDKRPILSDLRESGSIEQDSNIVMMLYRDEYYNPETEEQGIMEVILAKNRGGQVGTTKLKWFGNIQKLMTLDDYSNIVNRG